MNLQLYHQHVKTFLDSKNPRERKIICIASPLVILWFFMSYVIGPLQTSNDEIKKKYSQMQDELSLANTKHYQTTQRYNLLLAAPLDKKITSLKESLNSLDSQANQLQSRLSSANQAVSVIKDLIDGSSKMSLLSMKNLPSKKEENISKNVGVDIYKHKIEFNLISDYASYHQFIQDFEKKQPYVQINQLSLSILQYPAVQGRLLLELMSLDKEVLGV